MSCNYFTELPEEIQNHIYQLAHKTTFDHVLDNLTRSVLHEMIEYVQEIDGYCENKEPITKLSIRHLQSHVTYIYSRTDTDDGNEMYITLGCWSDSPRAKCETLLRQYSKFNKIVPDIFERPVK